MIGWWLKHILNSAPKNKLLGIFWLIFIDLLNLRHMKSILYNVARKDFSKIVDTSFFRKVFDHCRVKNKLIMRSLKIVKFVSILWTHEKKVLKGH